MPVGFDLEWDEGSVSGELLVGRARIPFDGRGTFVHVTGEPLPRVGRVARSELTG